jgi:Response regulator containing CheY-like receiver, AAA-type ATPase, and DNA-binding domains
MKPILFADDDIDMLDVVAEILRLEDYVVIGDTGNSIKEKLQRYDVGLILLDEVLPDRSGSNICLELKTDSTTADIPVILVSGIAGIAEIAGQCHADGYVSKPFGIYDILDMVNLYYRDS